MNGQPYAMAGYATSRQQPQSQGQAAPGAPPAMQGHAQVHAHQYQHGAPQQQGPGQAMQSPPMQHQYYMPQPPQQGQYLAQHAHHQNASQPNAQHAPPQAQQHPPTFQHPTQYVAGPHQPPTLGQTGWDPRASSLAPSTLTTTSTQIASPSPIPTGGQQQAPGMPPFQAPPSAEHVKSPEEIEAEIAEGLKPGGELCEDEKLSPQQAADIDATLENMETNPEEAMAKEMIDAPLAGTTISSYGWKVRVWRALSRALARQRGDRRLLLEKKDIICFIHTLYRRGIAGTTIATYHAALQYAQRAGSLVDSKDKASADHPNVKAAVGGLRKSWERSRMKRGLITPEMFKQLMDFMRTENAVQLDFDALAIIFAAGLRIGEAMLLQPADLLSHPVPGGRIFALFLRQNKGRVGLGNSFYTKRVTQEAAALFESIAKRALQSGCEQGFSIFPESEAYEAHLRGFIHRCAKAFGWPEGLVFDGPHCLRHGYEYILSMFIPDMDDLMYFFQQSKTMVALYTESNEKRLRGVAAQLVEHIVAPSNMSVPYELVDPSVIPRLQQGPAMPAEPQWLGQTVTESLDAHAAYTHGVAQLAEDAKDASKGGALFAPPGTVIPETATSSKKKKPAPKKKPARKPAAKKSKKAKRGRDEPESESESECEEEESEEDESDEDEDEDEEEEEEEESEEEESHRRRRAPAKKGSKKAPKKKSSKKDTKKAKNNAGKKNKKRR